MVAEASAGVMMIETNDRREDNLVNNMLNRSNIPTMMKFLPQITTKLLLA